MAYLTKWVETYPVEEQTSKTIKNCQVEFGMLAELVITTNS